jgi:hypothetical protein
MFELNAETDALAKADHDRVLSAQLEEDPDGQTKSMRRPAQCSSRLQ